MSIIRKKKSIVAPYFSPERRIKMYHLPNIVPTVVKTTGFSQARIDHSTTEGGNAPRILQTTKTVKNGVRFGERARSSERIDSLPKTLNSLGIDGGAITRVSVWH